MIFNKGVLYKDRGTSSEPKKPELISLKDLPEIKDENSGTKDQENLAPKESQTTPTVD